MKILFVLLIGINLTLGQNDNENIEKLIEKVFGTSTTTTTTTTAATTITTTSTTASSIRNSNPSNPTTGNLVIDKVLIPNSIKYKKRSSSSNNNNNNGLFLGIYNKKNKDDNCECVPYYQCQNGTIVDDGLGVIDIRFKGVCDSYLHICCKSRDVLPPDQSITPKPNVNRKCGERNAEGIGFRITGIDDESQFGEFPWMVAVLKEDGIGTNGQKLNVYLCGGSLIHPQAVFTAAHGVAGKQPQDLKVRIGEWDTQTKDEPLPHQDRTVSKIIVHQGFHPGNLRNNFAILILSEPVVPADNANTICLPERNDIFDNTKCLASGWGKNVFGKEGRYQVIMKRVELPVVNRAKCQEILRTTRLGTHFILHQSFICAGGEAGKDTCRGDGGSPLVCPLKSDTSRYVQAGIVSWGIGCGEMGIPGVYANVPLARDWIDEKLSQNNIRL